MGAVKREGGLKPFSDPGKPPLFLVKRTNGKYAPAYRSGRKKWAIRGLVSPSIPQIIKNEETVRAMEQSAEERFSKRVEHEIYDILDTLTR